jgi:hypothetical protein
MIRTNAALVLGLLLAGTAWAADPFLPCVVQSRAVLRSGGQAIPKRLAAIVSCSMYAPDLSHHTVQIGVLRNGQELCRVATVTDVDGNILPGGEDTCQ